MNKPIGIGGIPAAPVDPAAPASTAPVPEEGSFLASLPPEYQKEPSFQKFKSADDMYQNYLALERYKGRSIAVPKEDAPAEERQAYLDKLQQLAPELTVKPSNPEDFAKMMGVPDSPEGYAIPEGMNADDLGQFNSIAHAAGLTPEQYQVMLNKNMEIIEQSGQQQKDYFDGEAQRLHSEWGAAYNDRYNLAAAAARASGNAGDAQMFTDGSAAPATIEAYYNIAKLLPKEGLNMVEKEVISNRLTPAEAEERIGEIMMKLKELPMGDPSRNALLKEKSDMFRMMSAGEKPRGIVFADDANNGNNVQFEQ